MWTIMWTENSQDRWDRLETKEEVMQLLDSLDRFNKPQGSSLRSHSLWD